MKRIFSITIIIIAIATIFSGCNQDLEYNDVETNEKLIYSEDFYVNSKSTDLATSVRGTVFLSGVEGILEHAQIVSMIEIDRDDWGGGVFYIPNKWHISSITSSYTEDENEKIPEDYVAIWTPDDPEYEWSAMIEIDRDHSYASTGGGKGTVVIELAINKDGMSTTEVFSFIVGVGCEEKDGARSIHPDYELIEIPISFSKN